jgi:hypothetical protein
MADGALSMFDNCFLGNDDYIPIVVDGTNIEKMSNFNHRTSINLLPETNCTFIAEVINGTSNMILSNLTEQTPTQKIGKQPFGYTCINYDSIKCTALTYGTMLSSKRFQEPCINSLNIINELEKTDNSIVNVEFVATVSDSGLQNARTYILCPGTEYNVSEKINDFDSYPGKILANNTLQLPFSNVHILCGANGNSNNNCTINGGQTQVHVEKMQQLDAHNNNNNNLNDILLLGITFTNATMNNIFISGGIDSEVIIQDCIFQVSHTSKRKFS